MNATQSQTLDQRAEAYLTKMVGTHILLPASTYPPLVRLALAVPLSETEATQDWEPDMEDRFHRELPHSPSLAAAAAQYAQADPEALAREAAEVSDPTDLPPVLTAEQAINRAVNLLIQATRYRLSG